MSRRRTDYDDKNWPNEVVNAGIAKRIMHAAPGAEIKLRGPTGELHYDLVRLLTWGDVLTLLDKAGIIKIDYEKEKITKEVVGFGKVQVGDLDPRETDDFDEVVTVLDNHELAGLDIDEPYQRGVLVFRVISRCLEEIIVKYKGFDFTDFLDEMRGEVMNITEGISREKFIENGAQLRNAIEHALIAIFEKRGVKQEEDSARRKFVTWYGDKKYMSLDALIASLVSNIDTALGDNHRWKNTRLVG